MPAHLRQSRANQGRKLRALYRTLGWSRADCAKFLHVTERSLHNWESGRHAIPFAAYRLLRIHCGYRLPGRAWDGWSISAGKLWTPEGHGLRPQMLHGGRCWCGVLKSALKPFGSFMRTSGWLAALPVRPRSRPLLLGPISLGLREQFYGVWT